VCNDVPRFAAPQTRAAPPQDITVLAGPALVGAEPAHAPHVEFQSHSSVDPVGTAFFERRRENRLRRDEGLEHA
jgi:hypothetical protein